MPLFFLKTKEYYELKMIQKELKGFFTVEDDNFCFEGYSLKNLISKDMYTLIYKKM